MNLDADSDGLPDAWESVHGLDPQNSADAPLDADHDGVTNLDEYLSGTDPQDAGSRLRIETLRVKANSIALGFTALANRTYQVESRNAIDGTWNRVEKIDAQPNDRSITVTNILPSLKAEEFYRVRTP